MKIVCISDTHGDHEQVSLPEGDVLVHAGDITAHGTEADVKKFISWFAEQSFTHKLFIAGNHDTFVEQHPEKVKALSESASTVFLNDSGFEVQGFSFWGSPITPRFLDWSFMRDEGEDIEKHWRLIPKHTSMLITHGPAWGILDEVQRSETFMEHTGCPSLKNTVDLVKPAYHVFGHIHEGYGEKQDGATTFLNVSTMGKSYRIQNAPVLVEANVLTE